MLLRTGSLGFIGSLRNTIYSVYKMVGIQFKTLQFSERYLMVFTLRAFSSAGNLYAVRGVLK